jgi:hypothetical protein
MGDSCHWKKKKKKEKTQKGNQGLSKCGLLLNLEKKQKTKNKKTTTPVVISRLSLRDKKKTTTNNHKTRGNRRREASPGGLQLSPEELRYSFLRKKTKNQKENSDMRAIARFSCQRTPCGPSRQPRPQPTPPARPTPAIARARRPPRKTRRRAKRQRARRWPKGLRSPQRQRGQRGGWWRPR